MPEFNPNMDRGLIVKRGITIGDRVCLKGRKRSAIVVAMLEGEYEGGVELNVRLGKFRYWNVSALEKKSLKMYAKNK